MNVRWFSREGDLIRLVLHVQPGAKVTEAIGLYGEALKVRLAAPPVDGKANLCLMVWLAHVFAVPQRQVVMKSGQTSRHKVVEIHGSRVDPASLLKV